MIQRNLRLDQQYNLIESWYAGSENPQCCENCNKIITNIAKVQGSKDGRYYHIGMDCAATLSGIKESLMLSQHGASFSQAKQARAKLLKLKKAGYTITLQTFTDTANFYKEVGSGKYEAEQNTGRFDRTWRQYPAEVWQKYVLPMIKNL